jgi:probable phosphoglycerate mutase
VSAPTELLLVRHGRTDWHSPNRYTGRSEIGVDEVGAAQAATLGRWSRGAALTGLYSSPMVRTLATAQPVSEATGLPVERRKPLREIDFGVAEGHTVQEMSDIDAAAVEAFLADPVTGHWPGGDDPELRATAAAADLAEIASTNPGGRVLVVTHSTLLRLVLCRLLGIPLSRYRQAIGRPEPAAVSTLRWDGVGLATLAAFNVRIPEGS